MYSKTNMWISLLGIVALALAGCSPTPTPTPTLIPTIDVQPTLNAVSTQSAQTVVAALTLNAPTATPVVPTDTPAPTNTPAPTDTPAPTATETRAFIPWTKTPTATAVVYGCTVTAVSPVSDATLTVNQDFDGKWTVKNSGTETWHAGNTDIRFIEGTSFQQGGDVYDLGNDVAPNGTYTIAIDMKAPGSDGTYSASWGIYLEDGSVCTLNLKFNVKNSE